ncbi:MAG: helix-turn-helix transcriptional regulator [Vicinamibacterales bacterium]
MQTRRKSSIRDRQARESPEGDVHHALFSLLRGARLNRHLSQQALARKLGLRQRQISDLERAAMDPRLSTVRNVARALDLELMLVPRALISAVEGLERAGGAAAKRPMYALDGDVAESGANDRSRIEGSSGAAESSSARPGDRSKEVR